MHTELVGRQLGPYRIRELLGQGGMASVYKALTPNHQWVALKVLPPVLAQDPNFKERFKREAAAAQSLDHANIVRVYEASEVAGLSIMVMEYVDGGTLKDLLDQGAPDLIFSAKLLGQLAAGLQYAHDRNIIHRDVKPSNVLIGGRGAVKLTDFGLAKVISEDSGLSMSLTRAGANMGTARYMSPEQVLNPATVDARTDVYSLGVILFEMLCGSTPYDSTTPTSLMYMHVNDPVPAIRQFVPSTPEIIERILYKALAKTPAARFQSATELADAFAAAVEGRPITVDVPELSGDTDLTQVDLEAAIRPAAPQAASASVDEDAPGLAGAPGAPGTPASNETTDISTVMSLMEAEQRALFEDALNAYDRRDLDDALRLLHLLLVEDERLAPAWVLRSYIETNWFDQMRCAENALAVAPDLVDARLRVKQLRAERMPVTYGRSYSIIPAVHEVREQAMAQYLAAAKLEDENDPLNDPYQCPYCGVVNPPDGRKCHACQKSLMESVPPERTPTPALQTLRSLVFGNLVIGLIQLFPAFLWTWYDQLEAGSRLQWSMDIIFSTELATMMSGRFTETLTPTVLQGLLVLGFLRGGILLLVVLGLRMRAIWSFYLGILMFLFEIVWGVLAYSQGWTGPVLGALVSLLAGFSLFMLINAAPNFTYGAQRIRVEADGKLKNGASYWRLGQQFERKGQWALAVVNYRAATGAAPTRAEFYKSLGIGYNKLRRPERARSALEQALLLHPADPDIPALLKQVQANPGQNAPGQPSA